MALLWCDGFDTYGDAFNTAPQPTGILATKYEFVNNESQYDIESSGPVSGNYLEMPGTPYQAILTTKDITTNAIMIAGVRLYKYNTSLSADDDFALLTFRDGTQANVGLVISSDSLWVTTNGHGNYNFICGCRSKMLLSKWNYIEMKAYCHNTDGYVIVRVNGAPIITVNNIDTQFGSNAYFTRCSLGDNRNVVTFTRSGVDDFYVCDGTGNKNNDFLGPITVHTIFPDGDDTVNFATTGNANYANHYQQVNSNDAMWGTDYVQDATSGNRDIFTMQDTLNFANIHSIVGNAVASGITSDSNYKQVVSSNGTEVESTTNFLASTSANYTSRFVVEDDPDTSSAWTPATVNSVKFGIEIQ